MKKEIRLENLVKLNWKELFKSKTFWIALLTAVYGIYNGQLELVVGAAGVITLRDAITK